MAVDYNGDHHWKALVPSQRDEAKVTVDFLWDAMKTVIENF